MRSNSCPKCGGSMTEGFVLDNMYGAYAVSSWIEGKPKKSMWVGLKLGKAKKLAIQTWRCGRCGFLESYAQG